MTDRCRWDEDDPRVEEASALMLDRRPDEARRVLAAVMAEARDKRRHVHEKPRVDHAKVRALLAVNTGRFRCMEIARELGISDRTVLRIARAM